MAAKAVYREFRYTKQIIKKNDFVCGFLFFCHFWILYGVPEVREVSRNLPGARGFVVIEYGPILSHGDPVHAQNYQIS